MSVRAVALKEVHELLRRHRVVALAGPIGTGKSVMAQAIIRTWPGGVMTSRLVEELLIAPKMAPGSLLVLEDFELSRSAELVQALDRIEGAEVRVLIVGRALPAIRNVPHMTLGTLSDRERIQLLSEMGVSSEITVGLPRGWTDTPLVAEMVVDLVLAKLPYDRRRVAQVLEPSAVAAVDEILASLLGEGDATIAERWSLLDPAGKSLPGSNPSASTLLTDVQEISVEVMRQLARRPVGLYELSPRRFEELVAELLRLQGYSVTLTAATKDGGRDIHAARKEACGSFLYLVECKRYRPDNPVGVDVVRSLNGVVSAEGATAGMIATTSRFTAGAVSFQSQVPFRLALRDYVALQQWLSLVDGTPRL